MPFAKNNPWKWKPGQSGNPTGKHPLFEKVRAEAQKDIPAIYAAVRGKALEGDVAAAKLCCQIAAFPLAGPVQGEAQSLTVHGPVDLAAVEAELTQEPN